MKNLLTFLSSTLAISLLGSHAVGENYSLRDVTSEYVMTDYRGQGPLVAWFDVTTEMCLSLPEMVDLTRNAEQKFGPVTDPEAGRFAIAYYAKMAEPLGYGYAEVWVESSNLLWCFEKYVVRSELLPTDFDHSNLQIHKDGTEL